MRGAQHNRQRAEVRDERTDDAPYFIYYVSEHAQTASGGLRFNNRNRAFRVAAAINDELEAEDRYFSTAEQYADIE